MPLSFWTFIFVYNLQIQDILLAVPCYVFCIRGVRARVCFNHIHIHLNIYVSLYQKRGSYTSGHFI